MVVTLLSLVAACRGRDHREERFARGLRNVTAHDTSRTRAAKTIVSECCGLLEEGEKHDDAACRVTTWLLAHSMDPEVIRGSAPRLGELCTERIPVEAVMSALARLPVHEIEAREEVVHFLAQYEQSGATVRAVVEAVRASPGLRVPYPTIADSGDDILANYATYLFDRDSHVREVAIFALNYALEHPLDLPQLEGILDVMGRGDDVLAYHARDALARHKLWATRSREEAIDALLAGPLARIGRRRIGCGEVRVRQRLELDAMYGSRFRERDAARRALAHRATYCPYE